jgi:hypothetical protein
VLFLQTPAPAATPDKSNDEEKQNGPDERDEDRSRKTSEGRGNTHRPEKPASDKRAENTDDDITDEPKSGATHHKRRKKTGNESDDEPGEEFIHVFHPGRS